MTFEELRKIPFRFVGHLATEHEHCMSYVSKDGRLGYCDHTTKLKNGVFGRTRRHWSIDGNVYKTTPKFIEALREFDPKIVPIRPLRR